MALHIPPEVKALPLPEGMKWESGEMIIGAYDTKNNWWHWFWYGNKHGIEGSSLEYHQPDENMQQYSQTLFCKDIPLVEAAHIISAKLMLGLYE